MMKLTSKKFLMLRSNSKGSHSNGSNRSFKSSDRESGANNIEIKWEIRPSGMLVQKREAGQNVGGERMTITIRVSTVSQSHDVSIEATSTFGDLKKLISLPTGLHPNEQRLLYRGKEREDEEYLHMVGVGDKDKVLLLEDPAFKEKKLRSLIRSSQAFGAACPTVSV